jgi:hypothetical protein
MRALREIEYQGPFTYECQVEGDNLAQKLVTLRENFIWLNSIAD